MKRLIGILIAAALIAGLATSAIAATGGSSKTTPKKATTTPTTSVVPPGMIELNGNVAQPRTLKFSELAILPQQTISVQIGGQTHIESGPLLQSVLTLAVPNLMGCNRNNSLRWWILVTNKSGAAAVLGLGEVDPGFGNRPAILSLSEDGKFLTAVGPRLIVPGDGASTRDIAHVVMVTAGMASPQMAVPGC